LRISHVFVSFLSYLIQLYTTYNKVF
jgi:hypothetical protein